MSSCNFLDWNSTSVFKKFLKFIILTKHNLSQLTSKLFLLFLEFLNFFVIELKNRIVAYRGYNFQIWCPKATMSRCSPTLKTWSGCRGFAALPRLTTDATLRGSTLRLDQIVAAYGGDRCVPIKTARFHFRTADLVPDEFVSACIGLTALFSMMPLACNGTKVKLEVGAGFTIYSRITYYVIGISGDFLWFYHHYETLSKV